MSYAEKQRIVKEIGEYMDEHNYRTAKGVSSPAYKHMSDDDINKALDALRARFRSIGVREPKRAWSKFEGVRLKSAPAVKVKTLEERLKEDPVSPFKAPNMLIGPGGRLVIKQTRLPTAGQVAIVDTATGPKAVPAAVAKDVGQPDAPRVAAEDAAMAGIPPPPDLPGFGPATKAQSARYKKLFTAADKFRKLCSHHSPYSDGKGGLRCKTGFIKAIRKDGVACCYPKGSRYAKRLTTFGSAAAAAKKRTTRKKKMDDYTMKQIRAMAKKAGLKDIGKRTKLSLYRGILAKRKKK